MVQSKLILRAAAATLLSLTPMTVFADFFPVSSSLKADANTQVAKAAFQPNDHHTDFGTTGDFSAAASQSSVFPASGTPTISSTLNSSTTAHVDASGFSGNATLFTHWVSTNSLSPGDINNTGSFSGNTFFQYSFLTTSSYKVLIDVITTSTGGDPLGSMSVNHDVGFGVVNNLSFESLGLTGVTHYEYIAGSGVHDILVEHAPGSGMSPWPAGDYSATTQFTFTIVALPEPSTLMILATVPLFLRARRRNAKV